MAGNCGLAIFFLFENINKQARKERTDWIPTFAIVGSLVMSALCSCFLILCFLSCLRNLWTLPHTSGLHTAALTRTHGWCQFIV